MQESEKVVPQVKRVKQKEKIFYFEILSFRNITFSFVEWKKCEVPTDRNPEIKIDVSDIISKVRFPDGNIW